MASSSSEDEPPEKKSKSQCPSHSEAGTSNFMNAIAADGGNVSYRRNKITGTKVKNTGINIEKLKFENHKHSNKSRRARPPQKKNSLEQEADDLSAKLRIAYQKIKLPNVQWLDEGNLLVGSYYVDLQIVDEEKSASNEEANNERLASNEEAAKEERSASNKEANNDERSISIEEIFGGNAIGGNTTAPKRILVSAPPGYGKTTLAHKIIYDWSQQQEYVRRYKFAFLVKLRNLTTSVQSEIADIAELCGFENKDAVSKVLSNNASSTLVILDGLDELNPQERINVYRVLFRTQLSNITVVTTCRTGGYTMTWEDKDILFKGIEKSTEFQDRKITIQGLNESNREKLLRMCMKFPDKSGVINRIREIIAETAIGHEERQLFECPLFVILLAFIVEEKSDVVIETKTDLFKCLIDCMIRRSCCKNGTQLKNDFTVFDTQEAWNYYRNVVYQFGKLSTEVVVNKNGSLHFDCNENTNAIYEMGFFIKHCDVHMFSKKYYYEAFHLSIMEFVSAYFMWLEFKDNNSMFKYEIFPKIICLFDDDKSSSLIIPFLFGLFGDELSVLINNLIPYSITSSKTHSKEHYFSECKCVQNLPDSVHVLFPKVMDGGESWLTQTQLLNKLLPWKTLKFTNDITAIKDFANLSHGVAVNYLKIEMNSQFNLDVPLNFDYSTIRCKKLKLSIKRDVENVEILLDIFNAITATETKTLKFSDYRNYQQLDSPKINEILATVTKENPKNCHIVLNYNTIVRHITNYTNLTKVVMNSGAPMPVIPESILSAMSVSTNLQTLCIVYYENDLDISLLTKCGKKQWESVTLERVKTVSCGSEIINEKCILSFQNINCGNDTTLFGSIVPDLLQCDDVYITEAIKSPLFLTRWPSVKELILEIYKIVSFTEVMSCLTNLCRIHTPTIRLRHFSYSCNWSECHLNGGDCAGIYGENTLVDCMKSFNVTEIYIRYSLIVAYHRKTCLLKPFARAICNNQGRVNTIIFDYYEECIADACTCLSSGNLDKVVVVLHPSYLLPNVDVVSRIDFTKFQIQYGNLSDFLRKPLHMIIGRDKCICINLKSKCNFD